MCEILMSMMSRNILKQPQLCSTQLRSLLVSPGQSMVCVCTGMVHRLPLYNGCNGIKSPCTMMRCQQVVIRYVLMWPSMLLTLFGQLLLWLPTMLANKVPCMRH